jgi:DsbC/DsbD-like thiol-disulfide interchange protein
MRMQFTINRILRVAAVIAPLLQRASVAAAQDPNPVTWSARAVGKPVHDVARVVVVATIAPGWHVYSLTQPEGGPSALSFTIPATQPAKIVGAVKGPKPRVESQSAFDVPVELYDGTSEFTVPLKLSHGVGDKGRTITLVATWQSCSSSMCLPPHSADIPVDIATVAKR